MRSLSTTSHANIMAIKGVLEKKIINMQNKIFCHICVFLNSNFRQFGTKIKFDLWFMAILECYSLG